MITSPKPNLVPGNGRLIGSKFVPGYCPNVSRFQRLIEVVAEVFERFKADGKANQAVGDAVGGAGGGIVARVRHGSGLFDERFDGAEYAQSWLITPAT